MKQFIKIKNKTCSCPGMEEILPIQTVETMGFSGPIIRILLTRSCLYFISPGIYSTESIIDYTFVTCLLDSQER